MYRILGIGELLWDMLPEGAQLGGAPANYSVMAGRLGDSAAVVSRVGNDELGDRALAMLGAYPVDCALLQRDDALETGQVTVTLIEGQPSYTIHEPAAWDMLELSAPLLAAAGTADAVCFGSLAQRHAKARATIQALVRETREDCVRIFDVNLRPPYGTAEIVRETLRLASVIKMNDLEVPLVLELLGLPGSAGSDLLHGGADRLLDEFTNLNMAAITRGGKGSLLVGRNEWNAHPGVAVKVADTIGAGDAFTAAMTHYLLRGAPLATLNEAGNRWGSFIASHRGAMPEIGAEVLARIEREIEG